MLVRVVPLIVIVLIFFIGAVLYRKSFSFDGGLKFSRDVTRRNINRISEWYKKEFTNTETDALLKQAGIKMSALFYQLIRYSLLIPWMVHDLCKTVQRY